MAALSAIQAPARAAVEYSAGNGVWNSPSNWSPNRVPGTGDVTRIKNGATVAIDGPGRAFTLEVDLGSGMTLDAGSDLRVGSSEFLGDNGNATVVQTGGEKGTSKGEEGTSRFQRGKGDIQKGKRGHPECRSD